MWNRLNGKLKNGSIILCHNGTKHTADSLGMIIKNIKQAGYKIVPVSELTTKTIILLIVLAHKKCNNKKVGKIIKK